jgi:hypothetical protein
MSTFHQNLYIIASLQSKYPSINSVKFYKNDENETCLVAITNNQYATNNQVIIYNANDLNKSLFEARFQTEYYNFGKYYLKSTRFAEDENYIFVSNASKNLQMYNKKKNKVFNLVNSNSNAVAIENYNGKQVLVYNDGNTLKVQYDLFDPMNKTFEYGDKVERIQIGKNNNGLDIRVLSKNILYFYNLNIDGNNTTISFVSKT